MSQAANVQKLRELTGAGVMACKKALDEAGGDLEKALALIKARGLAKAAEREEREARAGLIEAYVHNDRIGVLLELNSETDFVARSPLFKELAHNLAMQIAAMAPADLEALLAQPYIRDEKMTIDDLIKEAIMKTGENIKVGRFIRYAL